MCCGFCSSTLRSQNTIRGQFAEERRALRQIDGQSRQDGDDERRPDLVARLGGLTQRRAAEQRPAQPARSQDHRELEADRGMNDRRQRDRGRGSPPARRRACHGMGDRQPAQGQRHQPIQDHRLEEVIRADVPGLGREEEADGDPADRRPEIRPGRPASRRTPQQVARKVMQKTRKRPAGSPNGRETASSSASEPRWGLNSSNARTKESSA